jgi:hypothetical protein
MQNELAVAAGLGLGRRERLDFVASSHLEAAARLEAGDVSALSGRVL